MMRYFIILFLMISILSACSNQSPKAQHENSMDLYTQTYEVESFELETLKLENNITFDDQRNVGPIKDAVNAVEKAKKLWDEDFGVVNGKYYDPTNGRKVEIYFDENNSCWFLSCVFSEEAFESVPMALIKSNGDVLAVWMP